PDFTFGLQGAAVASNGLAPSANGDDQIFGTMGFNIPLWQEPRQAMITEAKAGISETQALLGSTRSDLRFRVEDAYFRAKTAREVSDLFRTRLIPDAKQAYEVTLTSYAAGKDTFTNVIDTWRQWLTYQLQFAQNRAQLGKATKIGINFSFIGFLIFSFTAPAFDEAGRRLELALPRPREQIWGTGVVLCRQNRDAKAMGVRKGLKGGNTRVPAEHVYRSKSKD
ncbi:TolC family protein, partial [Akkermansiaceae bacterium]|nr:TolC family protein [Akkermansiaceae bacterium]